MGPQHWLGGCGGVVLNLLINMNAEKNLFRAYLQVALDRFGKAANPATPMCLLRLAAQDVAAHRTGLADMTGVFREVIQRAQNRPLL